MCSTCKVFKDFNAFSIDNSSSTGLGSQCTECNVKGKALRMYKIAVSVFGKLYCSKCGYSKNVAALDFHHINKEDKLFNISEYKKYNKVAIKTELGKCVILCSNCHRELHSKYGASITDSLKNIID